MPRGSAGARVTPPGNADHLPSVSALLVCSYPASFFLLLELGVDKEHGLMIPPHNLSPLTCTFGYPPREVIIDSFIERTLKQEDSQSLGSLSQSVSCRRLCRHREEASSWEYSPLQWPDRYQMALPRLPFLDD